MIVAVAVLQTIVVVEVIEDEGSFIALVKLGKFVVWTDSCMKYLSVFYLSIYLSTCIKGFIDCSIL